MSQYTIRVAQDTDNATITDLVISAMSSDAFDQSLFPSSTNQPSDRHTWMLDLWHRQLSNPDAYLLIAHPPMEPHETAGFACWIHTAEQPARPSSTDADPPATSPVVDNVTETAMGEVLPVGMSPTAYRECIDKLEAARREVLDASRPCYHLTMLATSARHVRRGVGSLLFGWATDRADAEEALVYLEATPVGLGLYEKFGCEEVARVEFSTGGERIIMLRKLRGS